PESTNRAVFTFQLLIRIMKNYLLALCFSSAFVNCTGYYKGKQLAHLIAKDTVRVNLTADVHDSLSLYYTGCSGFLIRKGNEALLTDPFFTHVGPLSLLNFFRMQSDTARINAFFDRDLGQQKDTAGIIKAMLVTHSHYDHAFDIPYIYQKKLNKDSVWVYGNASLQRLLRASENNYHSPIREDHILPVENQAVQANGVGQWLYVPNRRIRVLPIITEHAPHFYFILPWRFFTGQIKPRLPKLPKKARSYKEGQSLAYLIDFLNADETINFRIYIQGSASNAPYGFPPLLRGKDVHEVDVAILCVASFNYVKRHPKAIIAHLKPRHVILAHWENFFQPMDKLAQHPMTVPFTDVPKFMRRFRYSMKSIQRDTAWTLPSPNTRIQIQY
ncbi:MAG: MBL fold metallo-hydrolase, partial [Bacteroidota bacterium]